MNDFTRIKILKTNLLAGSSVGSAGASVGSVGASVGSAGACVGSSSLAAQEQGQASPILTPAATAASPALASVNNASQPKLVFIIVQACGFVERASLAGPTGSEHAHKTKLCIKRSSRALLCDWCPPPATHTYIQTQAAQ